MIAEEKERNEKALNNLPEYCLCVRKMEQIRAVHDTLLLKASCRPPVSYKILDSVLERVVGGTVSRTQMRCGCGKKGNPCLSFS